MTDKKLNDRKEVLSAKISADAAKGWRDFCAENGITITAFLEVAGLDLAGEQSPPAIPQRREMIRKAREIDQERRSRRK